MFKNSCTTFLLKAVDNGRPVLMYCTVLQFTTVTF